MTNSRIAVLGAGLMGHGIAYALASAGKSVSIWDPEPDVLDGVPRRLEGHECALGRAMTGKVTLASSLVEAVDEASIVFEAAPEDLALKRALVDEVHKANPRTVFATNTSVLRISEIAGGSPAPDYVIGTHWWNPPYLIPIVEVVRGDGTCDESVNLTCELLRDVGKTPVEVKKDVPGFIGNRMQFALVREALNIVEEGIATADAVDKVARGTFGLRWGAVGPLENSDFIGLDLVKSILDYLSPSLSAAHGSPAIVNRRVDREEIGAKTGKGLFEWHRGHKESVEERLLSHLAAAVEL
ncbi:3-hydroxyacyl-CoA dehydrogenase family protein [Paramicrobacterium chengjingii]|uniref:3-hydroxyacyl-CoA dehydrogenase family protein n=1 Tax=Paramicrobacterium chengjingii TaxID=2769067 RepID=UPI00141D7819|nr:3-hydroxyacyl-CoA dehydrogenase NAD-binding domain-containing protein [Microbacterium chengjingii]